VNSLEGDEFGQWLQTCSQLQPRVVVISYHHCCPGVLMSDIPQQLACSEHSCRVLARGVDDHPNQL
jgi:hypothetical protein